MKLKFHIKKFYWLGLQFLMISLLTEGQVLVEIGPVQNNRDAFSSVVVYGSDGLSRNIPYAQINGSPFWQGNWMKAYFFDLRDKPLGSYWAKLNFTNQEVHYLDRNGAEKAVVSGEINRVVFMREEDSTKVATVFRINIQEVKKKSDCKNCFIQELDTGHTKLLKITRRLANSRDSLFGTLKSYYFTDMVEYFVQAGDQYNQVKRLNKEAFFSFIPGGSSYNNWIKERGLRFKNESDYLIFLKHYNATYRKD